MQNLDYIVVLVWSPIQATSSRSCHLHSLCLRLSASSPGRKVSENFTHTVVLMSFYLRKLNLKEREEREKPKVQCLSQKTGFFSPWGPSDSMSAGKRKDFGMEILQLFSPRAPLLPSPASWSTHTLTTGRRELKDEY